MLPDVRRRAACCELVSEVARQSGEVTLRLTGTSMLPSMWPGDLVTVRRCSLSNLTPGQVLLYSEGGNLVAHRILRIDGDDLIMRGDSVLRCDPPLHASRIVGRVVNIVRNGRNVNLAYTFHQRILAAVLRRSGLCFRVVLRLGTRTSGSITPPTFRPSEPL